MLEIEKVVFRPRLFGTTMIRATVIEMTVIGATVIGMAVIGATVIGATVGARNVVASSAEAVFMPCTANWIWPRLSRSSDRVGRTSSMG